jgi:1-acyl-sn-glycerol-3-phosphate acyltransferase
MLRSIWFYAFLFISTVLTAIPLCLWHILGWFGRREEQKRLSHYISYHWARGLVIASGVEVQVTGLEKVPRKGPVLFVSNHQSNFDFALLLGYINKPKGFVAKVELAKIPVISLWMRIIGCVFMDRKDIRQSLKVMNQAAEIIKAGQSLVIFPEGTRSRSEKVAEFKKGSLRLADKAGVPIVPVTVSGTYKVLEANKGFIKPDTVKLIISEPIYYQQLSKEDKDRIHELVRDRIVQNMI